MCDGYSNGYIEIDGITWNKVMIWTKSEYLLLIEKSWKVIKSREEVY